MRILVVGMFREVGVRDFTNPILALAHLPHFGNAILSVEKFLITRYPNRFNCLQSVIGDRTFVPIRRCSCIINREGRLRMVPRHRTQSSA